jgi:hypothetical protein
MRIAKGSDGLSCCVGRCCGRLADNPVVILKILKRGRKPAYHLVTLASIVDGRGRFQPQEPAMRSDDLTPAQGQKVQGKVRPILAYLNRLKKRMEKRRFPVDDRVYLSVLKAYDAIHELNVHFHYLSCESGVGRKVPTRETND